jgi:hypothetical protein
MDPTKKITEFYDHYDRYIFNINDPKKNYHNLNYYLTVNTPVTVKSNGIEKNFEKYALNFQFNNDSPLFKIIRGIEEFCERKIIKENPIDYNGYEFKSSVYIKNNNCLMYAKIPFRFNKYECEFVDKSGKHIQSTDITKDSIIDIMHLKAASIWIQRNTKQIGILWQIKYICVNT